MSCLLFVAFFVGFADHLLPHLRALRLLLLHRAHARDTRDLLRSRRRLYKRLSLAREAAGSEERNAVAVRIVEIFISKLQSFINNLEVATRAVDVVEDTGPVAEQVVLGEVYTSFGIIASQLR